MSDPVFTYDVFLSHNQADKPRVRQLAERLRTAGLRQNDLGFRISGFGFPPKAALPPAARGSDWVGLERSTVLFRDPANAGRRFSPQRATVADQSWQRGHLKFLLSRSAHNANLQAATQPC